MADCAINSSEGVTTSEPNLSDSEFVAVVFHSIQECYSPELNIECRYTIKSTVTPNSRDWIGVFRVGWQSLKEYVMYEWSPMPSVHVGDGKPISSRVVFPGKSLPKSDEEFYQFCYVTSAGDIRGASVPFQIKTKISEPDLECCEVEDEDGTTMLLVKNKTAILEEQLSRALDETATVKSSKETIAKELRNANERILRLEDQKADFMAERRKMQEKNETVVAEVETLKKSLEEKNGELDREWIAREDSERKVNELESRVQELRKTVDSANKRAEEFGLLLEAERLQNTEVQLNKEKLVGEKAQYLEAMAGDRKVIENLTNDLCARDEEITVLNQETTAMRETVKNFALESARKNDHIEKLKEELQKLNQEFQNYKQQLNAEIKSKEERVNEMCREFKAKEKQISELHKEKLNIGQALKSERVQVEKLQKDAEQELAVAATKINSLSEALQEKQDIICKVEYEMEDISNQLSQEKDKNAALEEDYETVVRILEEQLEGERAFNKSLCSQSDRNTAELEGKFQQQLALNEELAQHLETKNSEVKKLEAEVESNKKQIESYEERMQMAWNQITAADAEVKSLQRDRESLQTALNDTKGASIKSSRNSAASMYALQTAHNDLKKKYLQAQKEKEELWRERNDLKKVVAAFQQSLPADDLCNQIEDLRAKNEDLRVRLNMGAEAYKVKFVECRRLQSEMKKVQRRISNESLISEPEASISDVQSVVSKMRQALDEEKQLAESIKKALEDEKALAVQRNREIEELRQENMQLRLRVDEITTAESIQQSNAAQLASLEQLQVQLENLQSELETKDTRLINMERAFATEKSERECLVQEILNLQNGRREFEEVSSALIDERKEREKLGVEARGKILQHEERERELEKKVVKLEDEICRWKKEVCMYVEAERKFMETQEEGAEQQEKQGNQQQQGQAQGQSFSPTRWLKSLTGTKYSPGSTWTTTQQPWVVLNKPEDQNSEPPRCELPTVPGNVQPWQQIPLQPKPQPPQQPVPEYPQQTSDKTETPEVPAQQDLPAAVPPLVADWSIPNRECPVCRLLWPPGDDITEFERHVNNHFTTK